MRDSINIAMMKKFLIARFCLLFAALAIAFPQTLLPQDKSRTRVIVTESSPGAVAKTGATEPKGLPYLRSKIAIALAHPGLRRGNVGVKIVSLDSGEVVYERNSESYFMPASNMKSFTVAAALEKLGPDHRFLTSVYTSERPDANGTVKGDLIVFGRGDPGFSSSFYDGDPLRALDVLVEQIAASGVKKIEGRIVGDESYYNTLPVPSGWEWDDLQWYYGAEVSALSFNDNAVNLKILPGPVGSACSVEFSPASKLFKVINRTRTVERGSSKTLAIRKSLDDNLYEISGDIPAGDSGFNGSIAVSNPPAVFAELLKQRLEIKGIVVSGGAISKSRGDHGGKPLDTASLVELASHQSEPLRVVIGKIMKPSQNLYTELLLRSLGELTGDPSDTGKTSEEKGMEAVKELLQKAGVSSDSVVQYDASGLSRHNLITPNSSLMVYRYMEASRYSQFWKEALTIGGVDGTLRRRFANTSASANVRGKTGTIDQVSALSGYVTSKAGERFVFSIITNNVPDSRLRVSTIDEIVVLLSDFEVKTDSVTDFETVKAGADH